MGSPSLLILIHSWASFHVCCHDPCRHRESLRCLPGREGNELWINFNFCRRIWGAFLRGEDSVTPVPRLPLFLVALISRLLLLLPVLNEHHELPPLLLDTAWGSPRLDSPRGKNLALWRSGMEGQPC